MKLALTPALVLATPVGRRRKKDYRLSVASLASLSTAERNLCRDLQRDVDFTTVGQRLTKEYRSVLRQRLSALTFVSLEKYVN